MRRADRHDLLVSSHYGAQCTHGGVLQVMSVWCEGRSEGWFCTHVGWRPLGTASALASLLPLLVSTCVPPLQHMGMICPLVYLTPVAYVGFNETHRLQGEGGQCLCGRDCTTNGELCLMACQ